MRRIHESRAARRRKTEGRAVGVGVGLLVLLAAGCAKNEVSRHMLTDVRVTTDIGRARATAELVAILRERVDAPGGSAWSPLLVRAVDLQMEASELVQSRSRAVAQGGEALGAFYADADRRAEALDARREALLNDVLDALALPEPAADAATADSGFINTRQPTY